MKNYGNIVLKYVSAEASKKYDVIYANGLDDFHRKQLADLERFMKEDFKVKGTPDNFTHHSNSILSQGNEVEREIARLKAQVDNIGIDEKRIKAAKEEQEKAAKHIAEKKAAEKVERKRKSKVKREKAKAEAEARARAEVVNLLEAVEEPKKKTKKIKSKKK